MWLDIRLKRVRAPHRNYKYEKTHAKMTLKTHDGVNRPDPNFLYQVASHYLILTLLRSAGKCHVWRHKNTSKTRSGKGHHPLDIKTAVELPILKLGLPDFR